MKGGLVMRFFWLLQIAAILLVPPAWYAWRHRGDAQRALKGAALVLTGMYAAFFGMFATGEVFSDPGGWVAVGGTAAWLVPLVGLTMLAWRRADLAGRTLGVLLFGVVGIYVWSVMTPEWWTAFEDSHGPIRGLIMLTLAPPLAVLGWRRPRVAGLMLIALPVLPTLGVLIDVALGRGAQGWPIALVSAPAAVIGALLLAASARRDRSAVDATGGTTQPNSDRSPQTRGRGRAAMTR